MLTSRSDDYDPNVYNSIYCLAVNFWKVKYEKAGIVQVILREILTRSLLMQRFVKGDVKVTIVIL